MIKTKSKRFCLNISANSAILNITADQKVQYSKHKIYKYTKIYGDIHGRFF